MINRFRSYNRKFLFILLSFSFILFFAFTLSDNYYFKDQVQQISMKIALEKTNERKALFQNLVNSMENEVLVIANSSFLQKYIRNNNDIHAHMQEYLLSLIKSNHHYMQIRFLDTKGIEKIRVERKEFCGESLIVEDEKLQDKSDRYYFKETVKLQKDEIYISPLDLNIENKKIQVPYVPVIRVATKVYQDDIFKGVVIINYFMQSFLDNLRNTQFFDLILFNKNGEILVSTKKQYDWTQFTNSKENMKTLYKEDFENMIKNTFYTTAEFVSMNLELPLQDGLYIVLKSKEEYLAKEKQIAQERYIYNFFTIIVLVLLLSYLFSINSKKLYFEIEKIKQLKDNMIHQGRLAAMGEMISMIAHQWRQPLNTLTIVIQLINSKYKQKKLNDAIMEDYTQRSMLLVDNMSQTIDDFADFFKPNKQKSDFNVAGIIEKTLHFIEIDLEKANIKIIKNIDTTLTYSGYEKEFSQVLLNIFKNSYDMFKESDIVEKKISIEVVKKENRIDIVICDNGSGIPSELKEKIFEPYFTTKSEKNGTGLGLYMCKMIIEESFEGSFDLEPTDRGTCFIIKLQNNIKKGESDE